MEQREEQLAKLEALLFAHGEALPMKKIQTMLGVNLSDVASLVEELGKRLEAPDRGLSLLQDSQKVQLATKPQFAGLLEDFVKEQFNEDLTPAALETLALICYVGPLTRSELEYHRGVHSAFILRSLLVRGLVERSPHPQFPQTYLYEPSFELLKHLGIGKKEKLGEYAAFRDFFKKREVEEGGAITKNDSEKQEAGIPQGE